MDDTENAAELQFGSEFVGEVQFINNDEAFFLLSKKAMDTAAPTEVFQQTFQYLEKVVTTKDMGNLTGLANELSTQLNNVELELSGTRKKKKLHAFEVAALSNLIKAEETTPEEALAWIPSLSRFDDDEISRAVAIVAEAKEKLADGN